jgi:hypothetical protein
MTPNIIDAGRLWNFERLVPVADEKCGMGQLFPSHARQDYDES